MNALLLLALVPAALGVSAVEADLPTQAMIEMRIFQADFAGGEVPDLLSATYLEEINTYELDIALSALEALGLKDEKGAYELPGLGTITGARVVSAPRIVTEAGHQALIRTASEQIPMVSTTKRQIDVTFRSRGILLDLFWTWKEKDVARVEMKADVYGQNWRGIFDLRPEETAVLARPWRGRTIVLVLTFRPLLPAGD